MRVFVTGTRGIPDIPGGVESHCQELYPLIAAKGHTVMLCRRSSYVSTPLMQWKGVELIDCFAPKSKSLEAFVHTFLAIIQARKWNADIVHVHAVGPALMIPFARLLGLNVVMTNHGPDYNRQKWGWLARSVLKLGEKLGGTYANEVIVISQSIRQIVRDRCHRSSHLIYNGVNIPEIDDTSDYVNELGATPGNYVLAVARFVPEKGLHDLIDAFNKLDIDGHLIIAGDSDHRDKYSESLKNKARLNKRIILTGYITGNKLNQIFTHARVFVLPSYHEGLPIALLEALSYGLPVLVSDIPANKEVGLSQNSYFHCGDSEDLARKLGITWQIQQENTEKAATRAWVREKYNWQNIAEQTILVYKQVCKGSQ
jgi:glycosyltransferase involved in cell wall biosynthesis